MAGACELQCKHLWNSNC